ncbi:MAG: class I SAM-dependent methyltransferase [Proteobacteria bacterium]|nr:class I SAM-dependent methyltransferase [Pseudomonadota bacterium]
MQYRYRGLPMLKSPFEVALYQELLWEAAPRTVIEIGSYLGTSALWFADMLALRGEAGLVVSIDVNPPEPSFTRADIRFLRGDARRLGDVLPPALIANLRRPLLVVEDASHRPDSTLAVLRFFDPILQPGEYIIVEDALVTDLGAAHRFAGGPGLGISQFLAERATRYEIDTRYCDRFGHNVTGNPNGYLRRV